MSEMETNTLANGFIQESLKLYLTKLKTDKKYKSLTSLHKYLNLKDKFSQSPTMTNDLRKNFILTFISFNLYGNTILKFRSSIKW